MSSNSNSNNRKVKFDYTTKYLSSHPPVKKSYPILPETAEIITLLQSGALSLAEIARRHSICYQRVQHIKNRLIWRPEAGVSPTRQPSKKEVSIMEKREIKGIIYNSTKRKFVLAFGRSVGETSVTVKHTLREDEALIINQADFESSLLMRYPHFHFRAHDCKEVLPPINSNPMNHAKHQVKRSK